MDETQKIQYTIRKNDARIIAPGSLYSIEPIYLSMTFNYIYENKVSYREKNKHRDKHKENMRHNCTRRRLLDF